MKDGTAEAVPPSGLVGLDGAQHLDARLAPAGIPAVIDYHIPVPVSRNLEQYRRLVVVATEVAMLPAGRESAIVSAVHQPHVGRVSLKGYADTGACGLVTEIPIVVVHLSYQFLSVPEVRLGATVNGQSCRIGLASV